MHLTSQELECLIGFNSARLDSVRRVFLDDPRCVGDYRDCIVGECDFLSQRIAAFTKARADQIYENELAPWAQRAVESMRKES